MQISQRTVLMECLVHDEEVELPSECEILDASTSDMNKVGTARNLKWVGDEVSADLTVQRQYASGEFQIAVTDEIVFVMTDASGLNCDY